LLIFPLQLPLASTNSLFFCFLLNFVSVSVDGNNYVYYHSVLTMAHQPRQTNTVWIITDLYTSIYDITSNHGHQRHQVIHKLFCKTHFSRQHQFVSFKQVLCHTLCLTHHHVTYTTYNIPTFNISEITGATCYLSLNRVVNSELQKKYVHSLE